MILSKKLILSLSSASDRGRDKNGKLRPKSEGFELYNNSVQNGSPESPQAGWDSYPESKKISGEERLLKNRADHRSSPNVASKAFIYLHWFFLDTSPITHSILHTYLIF